MACCAFADTCYAFEPGLYEKRSDEAHFREISEVVQGADAELFIDNVDRIRIKASSYTEELTLLTRDEVSAKLGSATHKKLLGMWVRNSF